MSPDIRLPPRQHARGGVAVALSQQHKITTVSERLRILDLYFQGREEAIASYLLGSGGEYALVETGPSTCIDSLLAGLEAAGVAREQVTRLLLTHIHLDHAGAAGSLTRLLPNAVVCVHEEGYRHLADPSKLLGSATRIYGDQMDILWGEVLPVPEDRLRVLADGERVSVGEVSLEALYTPGHASHHIAYWNPQSREVFTGDVAGIRLPNTAPALPPTPPPDLDLELWSESIRRLLSLEPETLYLTHFGPATDSRRHLEELESRLYEWGDLVRRGARAGKNQDELAAELEEHADRELAPTIDDPATRARFRLVSGYAMNVAGYLRYYKKRGEIAA